ncbi:MAG: NfeD family protein [Bacillota bacterium]
MVSWVVVVGFLLAFMRLWSITVKIFGTARSVCVLAFAGFLMFVSRFFGVAGLYYIVPAFLLLCVLLRYLPKPADPYAEDTVTNHKKTNEAFIELLGEIGTTTTPLAPNGTVKFKSGKYGVVTLGDPIPVRKTVKCTQITNGEIYVVEMQELS